MERPDVPKDFEEDFLHYIGGIARIVGQARHQVKDRMLEALDQRLVGGFLAFAQPGNQFLLFLSRNVG